VALQSWALWVARGLGMEFTTYAVDGARSRDVVGLQLPAFEARSLRSSYDLGCLYIGVNDVRAPDWDAAAFAADYGVAVDFLRARCERVLCVTIPLDLGRPRAGRPVLEANAAIERFDTLRLDLRDFGARNLVMVDHVHPTAFGQVWIAERALDVLAADGMDVRVRPSTLISPFERSWRYGLQGDWTYVYRRLKVFAGQAHRAVRAAAARSGS
jgi:hypothetical protein